MIEVKKLMTERVITAYPETPLIEAVSLLTQKSFNGLPVVDYENNLVGLLTEHDMLSKKSYIHLLTLMKLLSKFEFYKNDSSPIKGDLRKILALKVSDIMNNAPARVGPDDSIEVATSYFSDPKNNPLPVVRNEKLVGILALSDITKLYGVSAKTYQLREADAQIESFVENFEKEFMLVTKKRAHTWFIVSILFTLVGILISLFFILRINL